MSITPTRVARRHSLALAEKACAQEEADSGDELWMYLDTLALARSRLPGEMNDIEAIGRAIKAAGHPALFMVDTVASLGCMPFEMDKWYVDVAMSGSQKGLMTPPGLGFVAANDRAWDAHKKANLRTPYWGTGPSANNRCTGAVPAYLR